MTEKPDEKVVKTDPKTFLPRKTNLCESPYSFVQGGNGLIYAVSNIPDKEEYTIMVYQMADKAQITQTPTKLFDTTFKVAKGHRPHKFAVCESGLFAVLSVADQFLKSGQLFVFWLTQKKLNVKLIKAMTTPVTSICFATQYSKSTGNHASRAEELEVVSPEMLLGCATGEIFAAAFVKKELETKLIGQMHASGVTRYDGQDADAVRGLHSFNVNALTIGEADSVITLFSSDVITLLKQNFNVIVTIVVVGVSVAYYVQESATFFGIQLGDATQIQLYEMPGLSPKQDQLPLFQASTLVDSDAGVQLMWVIQPALSQISQIYRITFQPIPLFESVLRELANQTLGLKITKDTQESLLPQALMKLRQQNQILGQKTSLEKLAGVSQLQGSTIDAAKAIQEHNQPLMGVMGYEYHILLVFTRRIAVVSYISNKIVYWTDNPFSDQFRAKIQMEDFKKRLENQAKLLYVQHVNEMCHFDKFDSLKFREKGFQTPPHCSMLARKTNFISECYTEQTNIAWMQPNKEDENVWKLYLEQSQFETALKMAKNRTDQNIVRAKYAEDQLRQGRDMQAAKLLAETDENALIVFHKMVNQKLYKAAAGYIQIKLSRTLRERLPFKPEVWSEDRLATEEEGLKQDYIKAKTEYDKAVNYRRMLTMMFVEVTVMDICYYQTLLKKLDQSLLLEFYRSRPATGTVLDAGEKITEQFVKTQQYTVNLSKIQIEDHIEESKMALENFLLTFTEVQPYVLPKVLQTTLLNTGMADLFAKYSSNQVVGQNVSENQQTPEFSVKFYIQNGRHEEAVALLDAFKDDKFAIFSGKILAVAPTLVIDKIKLRVRKGTLNLNLLIPIMLNLVKQGKFHTEIMGFCEWLVMDYGKQGDKDNTLKGFIQTFIFHVLAECGAEQILINYVPEILQNNQISFLELMQIARVHKFQELMVLCLLHQHQETQSLEKQIEIYRSVDIKEVKNIDNANDIYLGQKIQNALDSFAAILQKLSDDQRRVMYRKQFQWLIHLDVVGAQPKQMKQIQKKVLEKIFQAVRTDRCLSLIDAVQFIPDSFTVRETKELTDLLFKHNKDSADQFRERIAHAEKALQDASKNQSQLAQRAVQIGPETKCCGQCGIQMLRPSAEKRFAHHRTDWFALSYGCGHCFHFSCFCQIVAEGDTAAAKDALRKFEMNRENLSEKAFEKLLLEMQAKFVRECPKCAESAVVDVFGLLEGGK